MTYKQALQRRVRQLEMAVYLLGSQIMAACAVLLAVYFLADQFLGLELPVVVEMIFLTIPLLALFFVLAKAGPWACAVLPNFPHGITIGDRPHLHPAPTSVEPPSPSEPPRQRPRR